MPRRNENARSRWPALHDTWQMAELRAMSEHIDRKESAARNRPPAQRAIRPSGTYSTIKTTPEQIVRDFRRNEGFNTYEAAGTMRPLYRKVRKPFFLVRWFRAVHPVEYKNSKFLGAIVGVKNNRRHGFIHMLLHGVNWKNVFDWNGKVFNWACWAALIACLIYLGIFVFTPFTVKLLR